LSFAETFQDLQVWQRSRALVNTEVHDVFAKTRDLEFRNQIQSAAVSVMNNIAEGFERRTKKDFAHFLDVAKGSAGEVRSMLYLAEDRNYLAAAVACALRSDYMNLSRSISSLATSLRRA
jgi:four helix bundle protein